VTRRADRTDDSIAGDVHRGGCGRGRTQTREGDEIAGLDGGELDLSPGDGLDPGVACGQGGIAGAGAVVEAGDGEFDRAVCTLGGVEAAGA
jgi:hypothetical protein